MTGTPVSPLTGNKFYVLVGDGASTEAFTYLAVGTSVESDHNLDIEDAMIGDPSDPSLPASRQSAVKGRTWDMTVSGLADPAKVSRIKTLHAAGSAGNFQLMKNVPGANGGYVEQGAFIVTAYKESMADRGLVKFSCTLHGQGTPSITANS